MNIPHRRPNSVKRYEDRLSIANARRLADRYRNLNAYKLASSCISRLCDRVEDLEAQVTALEEEIERLDPPPPFDDAALLNALEEIGRQ